MEIKLPSNVFYILQKLNVRGYEAYVVGGCVRDSIMGRIPHDWDICTSALPEQVMEVFGGHKIIPTGLQHGTVTVVIDGEQYEITTYRIDGEYEDNRHPKNVTFTRSLKEDLMRRDFTINAMAYNPVSGLIDYFGGAEDIKKKIIRCVGNPGDRFTEDALRILRAIRFSITFGYKIELETEKAIFRYGDLLKNISKERICQELTKTLENGYDLNLGRVLQYVVQELTNEHIERAYVRMGMCSGVPLNVRLAHLFDFDRDTQKRVLSGLRFDNKTIKNVIDISDFVRLIRETDEKYLYIDVIGKHLLNKNDEIAEEAVGCLGQTSLTDGNNLYLSLAVKLKRGLPEWRKECYKISQLDINGNDILSLGYSGKEVGNILSALLEAVINKLVANRHDDLVGYVKVLVG